MNNCILVTYKPDAEEKKIYQEILADLGEIHFLQEKSTGDRIHLLSAADIVIALSFSPKELEPPEIAYLENVRLIQLIYAGADNIPFEHIPADIIVASNVGAFAKPIAEHVLALTLALAKNIVSQNKLLLEGKFDRSGFNQKISGSVCGIVGFGGNGREIAKTMRAMDMQIVGINRSGKSDFPLEFIGTPADLKKVLQISHVVVVATPLTNTTRDLIGKKELEWMKEDAILINVGRGDVINQKALYEHLISHPDFRAGIDTWWSEPVDSGIFKLQYPFFELPNIIGSPHCADHVPGSIPDALRKALENVRNFLMGNEVYGRLNRQDYLQ